MNKWYASCVSNDTQKKNLIYNWIKDWINLKECGDQPELGTHSSELWPWKHFFPKKKKKKFTATNTAVNFLIAQETFCTDGCDEKMFKRSWPLS